MQSKRLTAKDGRRLLKSTGEAGTPTSLLWLNPNYSGISGSTSAASWFSDCCQPR